MTIEKYKLIHGDCLEVMKSIPDASIDAVIADPPYGTTACHWDSVIPFAPMWENINRVLKQDGVVALFGSEPYSSNLRLSNIKCYRYDWVWNKIAGANFMNLKNRPFKTCENIIIFSNTPNFVFNPQRIKRTEESLKRHPAGRQRIWRQNKDSSNVEHYNCNRLPEFKLALDGEKHPVDLIEFCIWEKGRYNFRHPTKKPVALIEYLIRTYTNEGDTVLDFCFGSGTTAIACINTNRNFIGIELNPEYVEMSERRLSRQAGTPTQLELF